MNTKDPALTKTPINSHETLSDMINNNDSHDHLPTDEKSTRTLLETVRNSNLIEDIENLDNDSAEASLMQNQADNHRNLSNHKIDTETSVSNGTDTFDNDVVHSEHVNEGDNPARQPDRRDQQGSTAFDEGINEDTVGSEAPMSEELTTMNRYASIDNAQTRILNPDEKDV